MANSKSEKAPTPRQLRRQQQREANLLRNASQSPPQSVLPVKQPSEFLGPSVLVPLFCAMVVLGYFLYQTPGFAVKEGNELSRHQAVFTAVNAATLKALAANPNDASAQASAASQLSGIAVATVAQVLKIEQQYPSQIATGKVTLGA